MICMPVYEKLLDQLRLEEKRWLITGVAGFIGSNLLEALLNLNQVVVGLDNFETGHQRNLNEVRDGVTSEQWRRFHFVKGDIRDIHACHESMLVPCSILRTCSSDSETAVDFVLHHAALGSVPRSVVDPITTNQTNIDGFLNMLVASRDANVKRFVYAASSSTYGDHPDLPKIESKIGRPLSPYAVTKYVNELYADVFFRTYGLNTIGLRYFNIFGKRQDPNGAYAAVIPKWVTGMINNRELVINGDGKTSRDFCYIENVIQANLLAATTEDAAAINQIYNIAVGDQTTLSDLFEYLRQGLCKHYSHLRTFTPIYRNFRTGDVRHSRANIEKAISLLGYAPKFRIADGLTISIEWYLSHAFDSPR